MRTLSVTLRIDVDTTDNELSVDDIMNHMKISAEGDDVVEVVECETEFFQEECL